MWSIYGTWHDYISRNFKQDVNIITSIHMNAITPLMRVQWLVTQKKITSQIKGFQNLSLVVSGEIITNTTQSGLLTSSKHFHFMVVNDTTNRPVDLWNNTSIIGSRSGSKISCPNMVYMKILDHSFIHQVSQSVVLLIAPYTRFNLRLPPINHKTIIKVILNAHFILVYELYRRSCPKLVRNFQKEVAVHKKINNFVSCATDSLIMSHC